MGETLPPSIKQRVMLDRSKAKQPSSQFWRRDKLPGGDEAGCCCSHPPSFLGVSPGTGEAANHVAVSTYATTACYLLGDLRSLPLDPLAFVTNRNTLR